jgi:hypothetical protein
MKKESLEFGTGSFVGAIAEDPTFWELPEREQARVIGWANSCPVVDELTDPANPNPGRGPEAMRRRYAEINFWFGFINREAQRLNPSLYSQLSARITRLPDEPTGKYEPQSVPEWHTKEISPMGTLAGYALPRIFVEQLGTAKGLTREELVSRLDRGLDVVEQAIPESGTPNEFLATVAEGLIKADAEPTAVLRHIVSDGWLKEHNAQTMLDDFKQAMQENAPGLWQFYSGLSEEEKRQLKLA